VVLEAKYPRSRHQKIQCLTRAHFLANSIFLLCVHIVCGARGSLSWAFVIRAPPSCPNHPSKAHLQCHQLGKQDCQHTNFQGTQTLKNFLYFPMYTNDLRILSKCIQISKAGVNLGVCISDKLTLLKWSRASPPATRP
jgi:hypothetical protein